MRFHSLTDLLKEGRPLSTKDVTFITGGNQEDFLSYGELYLRQ
jgi:hypothetical protein